MAKNKSIKENQKNHPNKNLTMRWVSSKRCQIANPATCYLSVSGADSISHMMMVWWMIFNYFLIVFFFKYAANKPFESKFKTSCFIQNNDENRITSWGLPIINTTFLIQQLLDACVRWWLFLRSTQTFQKQKIKKSFLLQFSHEFLLVLKNHLICVTLRRI